MKVLVLAPHPDDESIGCGGALALHALQGDHVSVTYLTSGELGLKSLPRDEACRIREQEARYASEILQIKSFYFLRGPDWYQSEEVEKSAFALKPILLQERPELVYLPHPGEWHPDHRAALPILKAAFHGSGLSLPKLCAYEIWTPLATFTRVQNIDSVMATKLRAVRAHRSQIQQLPYDRAIQGLNRYRGAMAGRCRYAEVFDEKLDLSVPSV